MIVLVFEQTQGGDLTKKNKNGMTPAMFAATTGQHEVLQWLLDHTDSDGGGGIFRDKYRAVRKTFSSTFRPFLLRSHVQKYSTASDFLQLMGTIGLGSTANVYSRGFRRESYN